MKKKEKKKLLSIGEVGDILKACEIMGKHFGKKGQHYLGHLFWLQDDWVKKLMQKSLDSYNAFYKLPIEERLVKAGFRKNKKGDLVKTIEL